MDLTHEGHKVAVGLHPKYIKDYTPDHYEAFAHLLAIPEVVGLGEVGLDQTAYPLDLHLQFEVLSRALKHLQEHHVLIIHCREAKRDGQLYYALLDNLKSSVPSHQPIHLHCFCGDSPLYRPGLSSSPGLISGSRRWQPGSQRNYVTD